MVTVICVVYALGNRQSLLEKNLLRGIHEALTQAATEVELLRIVGDYLMTLYGCGSAMISLGTSHLEFLRGGKYFPLYVNDWPLHALQERFGAPVRGSVAVRPVNWLSSAFRLFDIRFGAFSPSSGILFEGHIGKKDQSLDEVESPVGSNGRDLIVFLGFPFPYMGWIRSWKRRIAESIGHAAIARLEGFYEQQVSVELGRRAENWKAEREYELSALVHDVNNTVQDLTLLCEAMLEQVADLRKSQPEQLQAVLNTDRLIADIERITIIARSVATVISDAKRRRELEKLEDLTPRELVEITSVVAEVISFAVLRAERKRIRVLSSVPSSEKLWVRFSVREHLETILRNLINNAILYSSPGSQVEVVVSANQDWVVMKVRDTGPGLTASECEAVFKAGYRGKSAKGVKGGLGIGLAESRRVTESAGGTLEAVSDGPGRGTTFIVKLPKQIISTASEAEHWALLVDDQPVLTDVYAKIAKALDLRPETAATLEEAVSILDRLGKPSLVLTDVHLGTGDGLDLVRYARQEFGKGLPILVVSGLGDSDIVERVLLAGATDFVAKPVSRRALFARMQSLLFRSASS